MGHAYPKAPCHDCGTPCPAKPGRNINRCRRCEAKARRCPGCGQILSPQKEHECASVDFKGDRFCTGCGKKLEKTGYERWKNRCGRCEKIRWRQKEKEERAQLRQTFGGKCMRCGYDRCQAALHFHHKDKSGKYDWSSKGNASIREIKVHPERFELVCANCHIEIHDDERNILAAAS